MCSVTSATDQRSGEGLKFHCASESPAVAFTTPCLVVSRYLSARSRSAWLNDCEKAEIETYNANKVTARNRFIKVILSWKKAWYASRFDLTSFSRLRPESCRNTEKCCSYVTRAMKKLFKHRPCPV